MRRLTAGLLIAAAVAWAAAVPTPEAWFGHRMGADRTVLDWARVVSYFQALEKASDRLRAAELGKSTEGRPFIAVTIAAPETLRRLDRYAWIQKKLADPRTTPPAEAEQLIAQGKTVVMITCSIHSTELGSTPAAVELAYKLLTDDRPKHRAILANTIVILVPTLNPDGLDLVSRWYRKTLGGNFEGTNPPELYQKYVGHDNNRDWYFFTQAETRLTVERLHNVWHPQIVYDVHQQGAAASRMFVPPWMDPIEPNIDPILAQECNQVGAGIASDLTAAGKTGVVINALYDFWSPARHYQAYHGGLRILTEAASARLASPMTLRAEQIDTSALGYNPRDRSWNYLEPWTGGEWRLRDIVDYELIAMESLLYQAALRREDMLRNFYRIGRRAIDGPDAAFVLPPLQPDPAAARRLLETLAFGQVEIERAGAAFEAAGKQYAPGAYVIRLRQPYGRFAKTLLERQDYPDLRLYPGGPPKRPYDVTAHTLPLLMGVAVDPLASVPRVALRPAREFTFQLAARRPPFNGLPAADSDSWRAVNRMWKAGEGVWRDSGSGDFFPEFVPFRNTTKLARPRIGVYRSFVPAIDEGWTRWVLEQFGFEYATVRNPEVLAGGLRKRYDVLIFPDQPAASIASGYRGGSMPEEFTGGLGDKGAEALKGFAEAGGTLVFLNRSCDYATPGLGISLKNAVRDISNREFYAPGALLNVRIDAASTLAYGLPGTFAIWNESSPAWDVPANSGARALVRYPDSGLLASGWLLGEKYLAGKAAVVDYRMGAGRAVLFGMRPQYRGQSWQTFKLLFNALVE